MRSAWYLNLFPGARISPKKDTVWEFETIAGGGRFTTSTGGTMTGRGADLIIIDDPLKAQDVFSEAARETAYEWFTTTAFTRLNDKAKGNIIVVMQRVHMDDLAGRLLATGQWQQLYLQAIAEEGRAFGLGGGRSYRREIGDVLHPERESRATLEMIRANIGSMNFAAQYQQEPVQVDGNLVKWSWFKSYDRAPDILPGDEIIVNWDTASSETTTADYTVGIVLQVRGERVFVLDIVRERLGFPQLRARVIAMHRQWKGLAASFSLLIEQNGSGLSLWQDLRSRGIHAIPVVATREKVDRMNGPSVTIESGAVWLPSEAAWLHEFKREILAFPAGKHDDQVDALSQALNHLALRRSRRATSGFLIGAY
ncbi:phage terminase large subunit [uncultured Enterovirga sp.]|uniref:phage terminase large subunit n=1 Tax=uncultured Enterovirga sp. TaxID=2026352 RepID=UPI0035CA5643